MKRAFLHSILITAAFILALNCSSSPSFKVLHQTVGLIGTNCYLFYDEGSGEAAIFDVGGPIDTLISCIDNHGLKLKYIFITHCHPDHVYGLPGLMKMYPDAKVCITRADYEDTQMYSQWETRFDSSQVLEVKKDPEAVKLMNFDYGSIGAPDSYLEDGQTFHLGNRDVKVFISPGHSRGSVCFYVANVLFSGDVLFYRTVGRTDLDGASWEQQVRSVRRLYALLPGNTVVYPGHNQSTDIGSEKTLNKRITVDTADKP